MDDKLFNIGMILCWSTMLLVSIALLILVISELFQ